MKRMSFFIGAVLLVQGCTYAISRDLAAQADKTLSFSRIDTDPALYKGTLVILGGTIVKTVQLPDRSYLIEVDQKELDHWGKPQSRTPSGGRFLVLHVGVLNPFVYTSGRELTVAAVVEGSTRQGIDDTNASYPVVVSRELKLWPQEPPPWIRPSYLDPLLSDPYAIHPVY
jgi:outer membrane lipoprotein